MALTGFVMITWSASFTSEMAQFWRSSADSHAHDLSRYHRQMLPPGFGRTEVKL
jgi:hypothetical protein